MSGTVRRADLGGREVLRRNEIVEVKFLILSAAKKPGLHWIPMAPTTFYYSLASYVAPIASFLAHPTILFHQCAVNCC